MSQLLALIRQYLPFNRFVAFVKMAYLNPAAAAVAAVLVGKLNILGFKGLDQDALAQGLAGAGTAALVWLGAHIGDLKWFQGHLALLKTSATLGPALGAGISNTAGTVHRGLASPLPTDDEERAAPPPEIPESAVTPDPPAAPATA